MSSFFIFLLVLGIVTFVVSIVMAALIPFWGIIDCAISEEETKQNKILWLLLMLLTWWIGGLIYGIFGTKTPNLKKTAWGSISLFFAGLIILGSTLFFIPQLKFQFLEKLKNKFQSSPKAVITINTPPLPTPTKN
ncbi:MAG: PLDc N-terminal domain-containing protein [Elusimicrobiota bacterium]